MLNLILNCALLNMVGGRNMLGDGVKGERIIFRVVIPTILVSLAYFAHTGSYLATAYLFSVLIAGSCLWVIPGWSFEEINGILSPSKYHRIIRRIGYRIVPLVEPVFPHESNRRRGAIMKGLRGLYDYPTFIALSIINPWALVIGLGTSMMGFIYYACGKIVPTEQYDVLTSELVYGLYRWFLVLYSIKLLFS